MLGNAPMAILFDEHPRHPIGHRSIAIGKIDMGGGGRNVVADHYDAGEGVVCNMDVRSAPAEIGLDRRTPHHQFRD